MRGCHCRSGNTSFLPIGGLDIELNSIMVVEIIRQSMVVAGRPFGFVGNHKRPNSFAPKWLPALLDHSQEIKCPVVAWWGLGVSSKPSWRQQHPFSSWLLGTVTVAAAADGRQPKELPHRPTAIAELPWRRQTLPTSRSRCRRHETIEITAQSPYHSERRYNINHRK